MEIITSHQNMDFDGLACILAAGKLYPDAKCILPNTLESNVLEFLKIYPEIKKKFYDLKSDDYKKIKILILVDNQYKERLGDLSKILPSQSITIYIYDHHPKSLNGLKGELEIYKECGASTTILIQKIREKNISITPQEATIFALGIYEDTGSLTFTSTKPDDLIAASYLLEQGANLNIISQFINRDLTHEQISLLNELVISSREYNINNIKIVITRADREKYIGDLAILTHKIRDLGNLEVLFCIVKMGDKVYLVARSKREEVNVGEIAQEFGGGGHPTAASASIKNAEIDEIIEKLLNLLTLNIEKEAKACDIMSSPVISLKEDTSIEDTKKMMLRFNHTGFPVVEKDKVVGIITRQDVERAFLHGLGNTPISSYMSHNVITAAPETPFSTIHNLILTHNIGRLPIIDKNNKLVGIVTRTDILQILHTEKQKKNNTYYNIQKKEEKKNLAVYLKSRLTHKILEILEKSGYIAKSLGYSAYVVGGFVRDLLMGTKNLDIDIVIEGSGIHFAEKLKEEYNGIIKSHYKFGTAVIILPDGFRIDVATARTEFYEYPTALPKVEASSIKYDLYRRDFTINALAIKLNPDGFGNLVDFFGGMGDIKKGIVRVLYNLSFIDDPTRIFRAIRFEQRLHFKIDKQTKHFIDNALKLGVFDKIANQRVRDELILILSEEKPVNAVRRMDELDILTLIHPKLKFTSRIETLFNNIFEVCNWYRLLFLQKQVEYWILYLIAIIVQLNEKEVSEIMDKFKFNRKHIEIICKAQSNFFSILKRLKSSRNLTPGIVYKFLNSLPPEVILFIMAGTKNNYIRKNISLFLTHYQKEKTFITGDDLIAIGIKPSSKFKEILNEVIYARLDGKIKTKEDEIEFVKHVV